MEMSDPIDSANSIPTKKMHNRPATSNFLSTCQTFCKFIFKHICKPNLYKKRPLNFYFSEFFYKKYLKVA